MKFKDFIDAYGNWNGITVVNNDDLKMLVRDYTFLVAESVKYVDLFDMEVVSFGFYDNELCVRVK